MYVSIEDKMNFIEEIFPKAVVDEVDNNDTTIILNDKSTIEITDVNCKHFYVIGDTESEADLSVAYRDSVVRGFIEKEDTKSLMNYCRKCLMAIEGEYATVLSCVVNPETEADQIAYEEQAMLLQNQARQFTDIINGDIPEIEME